MRALGRSIQRRINDRPGVYVIVHVPSGAVYVGESSRPVARYWNHLRMWCWNEPSDFRFTVVAWVDDERERRQWERRLMASLRGRGVTVVSSSDADRPYPHHLVEAHNARGAAERSANGRAGQKSQRAAYPLETKQEWGRRAFIAGLAKLSPAQRSANGRKGAIARNRRHGPPSRWAKK